jgi:hypothetical protein
MRGILGAILVFVLGAILTLVLERVVKDAREWVWRLMYTGVVVCPLLIAVLSDPCYKYLSGFRQHSVASTLIVVVASGVVFGAVWVFGVIGFPSSKSYLEAHPKTRTELSRQPAFNIDRPGQAEVERPTPHLQAELVIDSVTDKATPFHVRITNIGDLDITDVKINQNATVVRSTGPPSPMLPLIKILPKRGHVSMQGIDPGGLAKVRQFYATLTFKCLINGEVNDFLASYRFVLPEGALTPQQVLDPRDFIETTGHELTAEVLRDEANTSISDVFATRPVGTISFWTTEKNKNGEANYIKISNDTRTLCYDPVAHKIWLSSKPVSEALMMSFEPKDRHYIAFVWDELGPKLVSVDGKSKTR